MRAKHVLWGDRGVMVADQLRIDCGEQIALETPDLQECVMVAGHNVLVCLVPCHSNSNNVIHSGLMLKSREVGYLISSQTHANYLGEVDDDSRLALL